MKTQKTAFLAVLFLVSSSSFAQNLVWKTYDDFKNQKALVAEGNSFTYFDNGKIKLTASGEKLSFKSDEFWGFTFRGNLVRTINVGRYHFGAVVAAGNFVYYTLTAGTVSGYQTGEYFVSKDLNSPSYRFCDKNSLLKLTQDHPELKGLAPLLKASKTSDAMDALTEIIKASKEYKSTEELVPALKGK